MFSRESSFYNMFWNFASKKSSVVFRKQLVFRVANQQKHVLICWQNDGRNPKLFYLFYLFQHSDICICVELIYQTFSKPGLKIVGPSSSLFLIISERRNVSGETFFRLFFSVLTACPVKYSVLRWRPGLSWFPPRFQRSNKNTRMQRAVKSQTRKQETLAPQIISFHRTTQREKNKHLHTVGFEITQTPQVEILFTSSPH